LVYVKVSELLIMDCSVGDYRLIVWLTVPVIIYVEWVFSSLPWIIKYIRVSQPINYILATPDHQIRYIFLSSTKKKSTVSIITAASIYRFQIGIA